MIDSLEYNPVHTDPLLIVISGLSGVGKDTVIQRMKERNLPFHFVVTATSRPPRPNERHGVDYFFISDDEFTQKIEAGEMLEHAIVYGDKKGVPREQVTQALASGQDVVMRLDVQGAASIRKIFPFALLVFLTVQDHNEMVKRLTTRHTETEESLRLRIETARNELSRISEFDFVVVNEEFRLDEAVDTIVSIIHAEHHRVNHRKANA